MRRQLTGSERLNVSFANGADKERVKETQSINKSLSALGDVIAALGEKGEKGNDKHISYRNSSSRTCRKIHSVVTLRPLWVDLSIRAVKWAFAVLQMILNLSPLATHLNESLTSLRFATNFIIMYDD